ncbi:MAG: hypothetical protein WCI67_21275, partial [Chloroflexales bacterium]
MITPPPSSHLPRAHAALEAFPALHAEVAASLQRQAARAVACLGRAIERPRLIAAVEHAAADPRGGLVSVEGPPGSGVTSLIAALAARHAMPLWLAEDDPEGTFVRKMTPEWLKHEIRDSGRIPLGIRPWRSLSTRLLRWFVHPR